MSINQINLFEIRKQLHRIPELAFREHKTKELLLSYLSDLKEITVHHVIGSTGILVEYSQGEDGYLLFRADMDGLPIAEATDCDFASEHAGVMHACGHDVHMTILLGLIFAVVQSGMKRNLLFLFQPAEEGQGGALSVLNAGLIQSYKVKYAIALHVNGSLPVNSVSSKAGTFFAMTQEFDLEFTGKSAHAAFPEKGKSALRGGVEFCHRMYGCIRSLELTERIIFNLGVMKSGAVRNIIPGKCLLQGTHRTLSIKTRDMINKELKSQGSLTAAELGLEFSFKPLCAYESVVNDEQLYKLLVRVCGERKIEFRESGINMTGEDFGYFTSRYPGLLFWLGAGELNSDLHTPDFLPDENCIPIGINVFMDFIMQL